MSSNTRNRHGPRLRKWIITLAVTVVVMAITLIAFINVEHGSAGASSNNFKQHFSTNVVYSGKVIATNPGNTQAVISVPSTGVFHSDVLGLIAQPNLSLHKGQQVTFRFKEKPTGNGFPVPIFILTS